LIAGTSNIVSPHATAEAVFPAILFLAFSMVLVGLSFTILGVETHGVPMSQGDDRQEVDEAAERQAIAR
jgi:MFS transporter, putative metabolite:H+ symporter